MGRPRKLETLTKTVTGRIRPDQEEWLRAQAERQFEGELSRTLRWALDQAEVFTVILQESDPVQALDEMLNPRTSEPWEVEESIQDAEREFEQWKREQAIKRAQKKKKSK